MQPQKQEKLKVDHNYTTRGMRPAKKSPKKILPKMHEMSVYATEGVMALPSDSEGETKEELEYPGKSAPLVDWEEYHNQQMQFAQYEIGKTVKAVRKLNAKCELLENKLKMVNEESAFVAKNETRQALQLVCQPVPFDERDYTRVTQCACKDLFWTFKQECLFQAGGKMLSFPLNTQHQPPNKSPSVALLHYSRKHH